jgi:hypothetical protein
MVATLRDLIPAEFFAPPSEAKPAHGCIAVCTHPQFQGCVLVSWKRGSQLFDQNLEVARTLKAAGLGGYYPDAGGWCFAPTAAARVDEAFPPTLVRSQEFLAMVKTATTPARTLHGTIRWDSTIRQWCVAFGGQYSVPRDCFQKYLEAARFIKQAVPGSRGWHADTKSWRFSREAAGYIVRAFPAAHFDYPADYPADLAKTTPAPTSQPAPTGPTSAVASRGADEAAGPDPLATRLLAAVDAVLGV